MDRLLMGGFACLAAILVLIGVSFVQESPGRNKGHPHRATALQPATLPSAFLPLKRKNIACAEECSEEHSCLQSAKPGLPHSRQGNVPARTPTLLDI